MKRCATVRESARRIIALVIVSVLVAVSASARLSSANNTPTSSGGITLAAEPTGGSWKPFVLNASDAIRSVPPPAQGSSPFTQEVTELKALQANRTPAVNERIATGITVLWYAGTRSPSTPFNEERTEVRHNEGALIVRATLLNKSKLLQFGIYALFTNGRQSGDISKAVE